MFQIGALGNFQDATVARLKHGDDLVVDLTNIGCFGFVACEVNVQDTCRLVKLDLVIGQLAFQGIQGWGRGKVEVNLLPKSGNVRHGILADKLAFLDKHRAITYAFQFVQDVAADHDGLLIPAADDQVSEVVYLNRVESAHGFVEQDELRVAEKCLSHGEAPQHAM